MNRLTVCFASVFVALVAFSPVARANPFDGVIRYIENQVIFKSTLESGLLSGIHAKEVCSCVFVVGQTEQFCIEMFKEGMSSVGLTSDNFLVTSVNRANKRVDSYGTALGYYLTMLSIYDPDEIPHRSAVYRGAKLGCQLEP